jgi:superfamily II DNA or RNA helicase
VIRSRHIVRLPYGGRIAIPFIEDNGQEQAYVQLTELVAGLRVAGVLPDGEVTLIAVQAFGDEAAEVTYKDGDGEVRQRVLYRTDEAKLKVADSRLSFDGDGAEFRLAAEALRIRMAGQHDAMLAITTSDLDPLPHQIRAVYGELLSRVPLRFLLADDPGAGKTIMAGLYIKELALRGDLARCLIVAPGGLVEQWQDELHEKLGMRFELLTGDMIGATSVGEQVFATHPLLIARMDQLARNDELLADLERTDWDLVVVDEAHRMSAHWYGNELKTTRRYELGRLLGRVARHFLLMTATPHAGKEEDFQSFMALLDPDRFEGRYRPGEHQIDTRGLMLRRVKEEMRTFEGRALFPERRASTVPYELSPAEQELYEAVTHYVRTEMNRADALRQTGEGRRGNTVGFALTVLQRRLASSPEAILRSLERRQQRLETRLRELQAQPQPTLLDRERERRIEERFGADLDDLDDALEDLGTGELERFEEEVVDAATAARTAEELRHEIAVVADLVTVARRVRHAGTDRKWNELRDLLLSGEVRDGATGALRKIIVFTEHRDTLSYLVHESRALLGRGEAVAAIHGGMPRPERRAVQARFTADPECAVLIATDAAGEGLNLQRAHLMVNYDLPWNPNRIEQRFGRIHRIGQTEVCHLWNLVATDTREGDVFRQLLDKVEQQRLAYRGKVFDVLGEAFEGMPLRKLLIDAIRYGERPEVRARLHTIIDQRVGEGLKALLEERALHHDLLTLADVERIRLQMEEAQARRLQPHFIHAFFAEAFGRLGGRMGRREPTRFEISFVPQVLRDRRGLGGRVVVPRYERVCFDRARIRPPGMLPAELLAPGHPLFDAVVARTIADLGDVLQSGAVLVDRHDRGDQVRLLVAVREQLDDGERPPRAVSKRFDFVELLPDGGARAAGDAPYLDYEPLSAEECELLAGLDHPRRDGSAVDRAVGWAAANSLRAHLDDVRDRVEDAVQRTRLLVWSRLTQEINHWYAEAQRLSALLRAGKQVRLRPETAKARAEDLERRLAARMTELERAAHVHALAPVVAAVALAVPEGLLERLRGVPEREIARFARETAEVDRRAVDAVLAAERALGRVPEEMSHSNPGFDVRSLTPDGHYVFIEVKGRILGAEEFFVTRTEVLFGKNAERHRLALVAVHPDGPERDEVRYLVSPFTGVEFADMQVSAVVSPWRGYWEAGGPPR